MSFLQSCIGGGVAMLTPSFRRVEPLMEEEDADGYEEVFLPEDTSARRNQVSRKYCGWTALLRRGSQHRVMMISAPILDPDRIFVMRGSDSGVQELTERSKSDTDWQQRKAPMIAAMQLKQRHQSDISPVDRGHGPGLLVYKSSNTPDLLLHNSNGSANDGDRVNPGTVFVPQNRTDQDSSLMSSFDADSKDMAYRFMDVRPEQIDLKHKETSSESDDISRRHDRDMSKRHHYQQKMGTLPFEKSEDDVLRRKRSEKGSGNFTTGERLWTGKDTHYKRLLSTLSRDLDGMLRELNESNNGPKWKRGLSLQVTADSKQPIRIVSRKMGVLEQELNALSEALSDSDLSSSASSEQYFSLEDQQNPNLSEVSYTPSPDLFQSLPRDQSTSSYHRSHISPVCHHITPPPHHNYHYTSTHQNVNHSSQHTTGSTHFYPEPTYENTGYNRGVILSAHDIRYLGAIGNVTSQEGGFTKPSLNPEFSHPDILIDYGSDQDSLSRIHHSQTPPIVPLWSHQKQQNIKNVSTTTRDSWCQSSDGAFTQTAHDRGEFREEGGGGWSRRTISDLSLQERLALTQSVWLQPEMTRAVAVQKLHREGQGVFVMRLSSRQKCMALSVRVGVRPRIEHYLIDETSEGVKLENSYHVFDDLHKLVLYYATHLDELPVKLTLPTTLMEADRTTLLLCQPGFWSSSQITDHGRYGQSVANTISLPVGSSSTCTDGIIHSSHNTTYIQQTHISHTERTHTRHIQTTEQTNSTRYIQTTPDTSTPSPLQYSPEDTMEACLDLPHDSRRLSLSQINHSHKSPFSCPDSGLLVKSRSSSLWDSNSFGRDPSQLHNYFGVGGATSPEKEKNYFKPISDGNDTVKLEGEERDKLLEWSIQNQSPATNGDLGEEEGRGSQTRVKVSVEQPSVDDFDRSIEELESLGNQQKLQSSTHITLDHTKSSHSNTPIGNDVSSRDLFHDVKPRSAAPSVVVGHSDVTDLNPVETAPPVMSNQYSSDRMLNPTLGMRREPVVFRFDFTSKTSPAIHEYLTAPNDNTEPPLSAKTQYSSPAYAEPFDTLIVQGVSQTHGAIHVNDFIRQKITTQQQQQRLDCSKQTVEKKATSSRTQSNSKRINLCKPANPRPLGALDSSLTADPHYKVSLEEIPLTPYSGSLQGRLQQSPSQPIFARDHHTPVHSMSFDGPDGRTVSHSKPPCSASQSNARKPNHCKQLSPNMMRNTASQPPKGLHRQSSGCSQFPVGNGASSDCSTAEDVLSKLCPELIFTPIKSLTQKNIHRISDYDNCGSGFCRHLGRPVSSHRSGGTHYSQPWDSSNLWKQLLTNKQASQFIPPGDQASYCNESDAQSLLGSDVACSTFEWRHKNKQVVTTKVQTRPESGDDGMEEHSESSADESMVKGPVMLEELQQAPLPPLSPWTPNHDYTPGGKVENYVSRLAEKAETIFGGHVDRFVKCTINGKESTPHIVLRNVRQFMSGIKNYLVQHGEQELNEIIEIQRNRLEQNEFLNVDSIIESSLHKSVIKPLKHHMYTLLVTHYKEQGQLQQMADNIEYARSKSPQDLGIKNWLLPPSGETMESIHSALIQMQKEYSPLKKLHQLLGAMHILLNSLNIPDHVSVDTEEAMGSLPAEDMLPLLVYVLVQCGLVTAEIETEYMWGLLHPCVLAGEAGYYLTTLSSAVQLLKHIRVAMETHIRQELTYMGEIQGFMRVIIPDETCNNIVTRTLPVRPTMTSKDVCAMIAHRFRVTNPQNYSLYALVKGREEQIGEMDFPHRIKVLHSHKHQLCVFAFKRNNATFAWPVHLK